MKKAVVFVLILMAVTGGLLYFAIPNTVRLHQSVSIAVNAKGFTRTILDDEKWARWWPGHVLPGSGKAYGRYEFNGHTYSIVEKKLSSLTILIGSGKDSFKTSLLFIPINADTIAISWEGRQATPPGPADRLPFYYKAKGLDKDLQIILQKLKSFYANEANIYGAAIRKTFVTDSALISTAITTNVYPTVENIYSLIGRLYVFAEKNGAKPTNPPMLNVSTTDSINYITRVALPVDKKLKDEGAIVYRWMLGGGNILMAEVKGGPHTVQNVFIEMENYISDFHRTAPAIPFQSLVTDRSKEPDTSKWVTKLYWPVM